MSKKFDLTKPFKTREGKSARIICSDMKGRWSIVALVHNEHNEETAYTYNSNGFFLTGEEPSRFDLINVKEKHKGWINIYHGTLRQASCVHPDRETADKGAGLSRVACVEVEYEVD